jgi:hypothetical protein
MMTLVRLPANQCWAFTFGRTVATADIIPMGEKRFFDTRDEAVDAASRQGLTVDRDGKVDG